MSLKRNVLDLRKRKEIVLQGGGEEAIKKQAAMGKLTARERIEAILDKASFHEYDMFVSYIFQTSLITCHHRYRNNLWRTCMYLRARFHRSRWFSWFDACS